ncbi:receptor-like serine/threonine-protein kinase ALE2 isoform X1 [Populus alba x Populus x berolinensis]|uniref:Receptor-like serine/threonine-protein kinase ALE2 isoform X1 n=1 Tax=Populus alba x Populus x berolinensis TaxID=444605 RepID=A0AAD6RFT7_9ROSI|nr:receptor-like serine/threonine-protein kinase ALE2 isoform X1 [Populus alba]KAJ7008159.1 receptor-like serine/threonine-protein kinase ALE2 isoform X1 [Populus alba x Populus x berolinensis]
MSVLAISSLGGLSRRVWYLFLQLLIILCYLIPITNADLADDQFRGPILSPSGVPLAAPAIPDLPLPYNLPSLHKPRKKHFSPHGAPAFVVAPTQPPNYGPLITSSHPPTSSHLSKPSMKKNALVPPSVGLVDVAPTQSGDGTNPTVLAQSPLSPFSDCCKPDMVLKRGTHGCHCVYPIKLDLLLLNVSQNPNWNLFLEELSSQLGLLVSQIELINFYLLSLSRLNISMDIIPHTGISFSASDASAVNSSLALHKVHFDSSHVGDYKLLNLTWFEPPAPSPAPIVASSPMRAPAHQSSTSTSVGSSKKDKHTNLIPVLGIGSGIVIIAIVSMLVICLCVFREGKPKASPKETGFPFFFPSNSVKPRTIDPVPAAGSLPHPSSTRFLAYEELKEATNNFESASILGEGGFGRVFKGVLSDGTAVAIKRLTSGGQQGGKEFLVEVEMLSRLHHRNLVKLVGYYSSRDSSQNLLCYELVPNGSLEAWLHGPLGANCPLDWDTRMKIALDAARGLAYLHEDSQPCVIHRDFKASNILLEKNFHAKVSDFGLAKQAPEGRANYLSTRVMGTFGYVAPEYAMTGHLLVKSDVYSYGVVLLELLTGRMPVDMSQPSGQENLVTWARPILRDKDQLQELADPRLGGKYPKEDFVRVCTIAAACVSSEASQRPTMGEVVQSLKMVQRVMEYQDSMSTSNARANLRQSSNTFESDGTSSMFSSGPYSGLSALDTDNISRTAVFSEDLHEGR